MISPSPIAPRSRRDAVASWPLIGRPLGIVNRQHQVTRYLLVGGWNTAFGYGEWALLQYLLGGYLHYLVILVLAWPIAVANAYICYRYLVFRSHGSLRKELPRFSLVYVVTLLGSIVALPVLLRTLPFNIYVIQAGYTFAVVVLSYLGHRFISFGIPLHAEPATAARPDNDDA